jgi:hypothetical protein
MVVSKEREVQVWWTGVDAIACGTSRSERGISNIAYLVNLRV